MKKSKIPLNTKIIAKLFGVFTCLLTAVILSHSASAWGPERPTYTNESPADYATFNSITNNTAVGDERNFVRIREAGTSNDYEDEIEVVPGKEYEVYIYYHNNAATDTNASGVGIATNVRMASAYPTVLNVGERGMVSGMISWSYVTPSSPDDAQTATVWDEAYLTTQTDGIVMRYKPGTATIHNSGRANGSILPQDLFTPLQNGTGGTPLGYNILTGTLPGCAEYSGHVTYILVAEHTASTLEKQVSTDGENWSGSVQVHPGDYVTYKVTFTNTGNTTLTNAIFTDAHDDGLKLRSGSTKVFDVDNQDGHTIDDIIDISGYNMGDIAPGALVQIIYQAQVVRDNPPCGSTLNNTISVKYNSSSEPQQESTATVTVVCEDCSTNPDLPGCSEDCQTNPSLPGCNNCTTNPNLPGCSTPETCETNPELPGCELPDEIPSTGPLEIVLACVIVLGIAGAGFYLYRTKRVLKTVEGEVTGKTTGDADTGTTASTTQDAKGIKDAKDSNPKEGSAK